MAEEIEAAEEEAIEEEKSKGRGPGFLFGIIFGTLAGAAAATLFAPSTGEEFRQRLEPMIKHDGNGATAGEPEGDGTVDRVRALLTRVRSRVREAADEGQEAAQEAEAESRARYSELTHSEEANN